MVTPVALRFSICRDAPSLHDSIVFFAGLRHRNCAAVCLPCRYVERFPKCWGDFYCAAIILDFEISGNIDPVRRAIRVNGLGRWDFSVLRTIDILTMVIGGRS
jgi:hypothetical protein